MDTFWIIWIISVIITTWIASNKGEGVTGFFAGCIFGPLGILIALASSGKNDKSLIEKKQYGIGGAVAIIIGGIIIFFLCIQAPIVGVPLAILSIYKYRQERKERISYEDARRIYDENAEEQSGRTESNNNDREQTGSYQENRKTHDESESDNKLRIFQCPSCNQKIRVSLPLPKSVGKCKNCKKRFKVSSDDAGNLYVYSVNNSQNDNSEQEMTLDDCFTILQVNKAATAQVIKAAYRKRMLEYHPDKVANLGEELRQLAERKVKQINAAYGLLKKNGHLE